MFYDICTVNSAWSHGSFFLMLDAVSMHVTLKECSQNPKAAQCYEIILKEYIAKYGYPIAFCCDNAKNLSNELAADLAHILYIKYIDQTNKSIITKTMPPASPLPPPLTTALFEEIKSLIN